MEGPRRLAMLVVVLAVAGPAGARSRSVVFPCADGDPCDADGVNGSCRVVRCSR